MNYNGRKQPKIFKRLCAALCLCSLMVFNACNTPQDEETQQMGKVLQQLHKKSFSNINYPYHNSLKADELFKQLKGIPETIDVKVRYDYLEQLINAGRLEEGIEKLKILLGKQPCTRKNLKYFKLLGIAYMQLAEEKNCVHHAGEYACVMPMTADAIHQNRLGSEKAVAIFQQILKRFPKEYGIQWLLNIAYMTLGEYPVNVQEPWFIALTNTTENATTNLPNFKNKARHFDIDVLGHAGSCAMEDFDQDGYLDILTSSYFLNESLVYFKNKKGKHFENITQRAGLKGIKGGLNFIHGDVNNDGFPDVYITRGAWLSTYGAYPNSLLLNDGKGNFVDRTKSLGLWETYPTQTAVFADFNQDGWLDLFVGHEATSGLNNPSKLYLNQKGEKFIDYTEKAGINIIKYIKGVTVSDVDNDGFPDIYCSVFGGKNILLKNNSKEGELTFTNVAEAYKVEAPLNSFPCAFFDYDNDGWEDLFVSGYYTDRKEQIINSVAMDFMGMETNRAKPILYRNIEGKYFERVTEKVGLNKELYTMGFNFGDLNGDGWLDLFLGTGEFNLTSVMPNRVFLNQEGTHFKEVTFDRKFGQIQKGHGVAFGDYDNDGDEDIYHVVGGGMQGDIFHNMLYENEGNDNNWITLKLRGTTSNTDAIGAKVAVFLKNRQIHRTINTGGSFGNNSLQLELGIGQSERVDSVVVEWADQARTVSRFQNLKAGKKYIISSSGILPD